MRGMNCSQQNAGRWDWAKAKQIPVHWKDFTPKAVKQRLKFIIPVSSEKACW